MQADRCIFQNQ